MSAVGPSRHFAPPHDFSRKRGIPEVGWQPSIAEGDASDPLQKSGPDRFREEAGTLAALRERRKGVPTPLVGEYHGRIVFDPGEKAVN